jgi:hypothetical protein
MTKGAEAYCKASAAVDSGKYLKDNCCKLRKYRKSLTNPIPSDIDQSPISYERLARLTDNLNREIDRRKVKYREVGAYIAKGVLIGVLVGVILLFLNFFLSSNRDKQNISQPHAHRQKESNPEAIPTENKPDQLKQKTK